MIIRNIYKMMWFQREAKKQLAWLQKTNADKDLIESFKVIIQDYDVNIKQMQEDINAAD